MSNPLEAGDDSIKPYLLRAIYQWAIDHGMTPQVLVDAGVDGVAVPANCVKNGRIVLTIHPQSVDGLHIDNEHLLFSARFSGKLFEVSIPMAAVSAIYCRENGRGIAFQAANGEFTEPLTARDDKAKSATGASVSYLKLVK